MGEKKTSMNKVIHLQRKKEIRTKQNLQNNATGYIHVIFGSLEITH